MSWNLDVAKSNAIATLQRLATTGMDPLKDDIKAIKDRAEDDAQAAFKSLISNPANERVLADQYHQSDKSKGLDRNSELFSTISKLRDENFKRSKPQIDAVLAKYQEESERSAITGGYPKGFEDKFYDLCMKTWQELRPSQTVNPVPEDGGAVAPPAALPPTPVEKPSKI